MADALEAKDKSTDYSRTSGGHTSFDPSIRGLQDEALTRTDDAYKGVMGYGSTFRARSDESKNEYDKLYAELTANQNPYIKARTDPMRATAAAGQGALERSLSARGVSGSSFGNSALEDYGFGAQREIGNQSALATNEALGARGNTLGSLAGLNQNRLAGETNLTNTMNTLNSNRTSISRDRALLERAGLGLSAESEAATRAGDVETENRYAQMIQRLFGGSQ